MNQKIRIFLINQCIKGEPIFYEEIGKMLSLDLSQESDRYILSTTLGTISAYEFNNGRPLISSIAIYKSRNDHGYGFYDLCEELHIGKAKKLLKELYGFSQIEECKRFWRKKENFDAFATIVEPVKTYEIDFFSKGEIDFLHEWKERVYEKDNAEHITAKNYIMNSCGIKTQYWSNEIVKRLPELDRFNWRMWNQKGWQETPSGKIRVARFKPYTWARIYRKGDDKKDIFFTVGVDGNSKELVYKLDYYFEANSYLNANQKDIIYKNIPAELRWQSIKIDQIANYNWTKLLDITVSFISQHLHIYDKLIDMVWGNKEPESLFSNILRPQPLPQRGHLVLPHLNPSFKSVIKDYLKEATEKKELGNNGEELVRQYEINWLNNLGHKDLASLVEIVEDGRGFDIQSFYEDRRPKYIEVKTTTFNSLTPFNLTINEKLFAELNKENYVIYRLYNYDDEDNTADFFIIQDIEETLLLQPTEYRAYIKKQIADNNNN